MDETGLYILLGFLGLLAAIAVVGALWWRRAARKVEIARNWPAAEATVESGTLEAVADSSIRAPIVLPVFAFSYHVDEKYYSGRFTLSHIHTDPDQIIQRVTGRKLQIRYNPSSPDAWFISDEEIEGCRVEQKMGRHVVGLYPRD